MDTPLVMGKPKMNDSVWFVVQAASWILLVLTLVRLEQVVSRLVRLARRGRGRWAVRIAVSNPVINSYFLFTVVMFYLYVRLNNAFGAQGRHWLPFLLPIFLTGLCYAPRALTLRGTRRALATALTAGLVLYVAAGSYYALQSVERRFYPSSVDSLIEQRDMKAEQQRAASVHLVNCR
jgi:hypothetical protein